MSVSSECDFVQADSTHSKYMKCFTNPICQFTLEIASTWLPLVNKELRKYHAGLIHSSYVLLNSVCSTHIFHEGCYQ